MFNISPDLWLNLLVGALSASGTFVAMVISRRKNKADSMAVELANVEKAISIYRRITEDLQKDIQQLQAELEKLYLQNKQLIEENRTLKRKMQQLEHKLNGLDKQS